MIKRMSVAIIILLAIFGGTFAWYFVRVNFLKHFIAMYEPPPVAVSTTKAVMTTWHPKRIAIGSFHAVNSVNVSSEVPGMVVGIYFRSGQIVKEGQTLVRLDDSLDLQSLNNALAQLKFDQIMYKRQIELDKRRATSKNEVDTALAKLEQSQANVAGAKVRVDRKNIKAPFSGKVGIRSVDVGEYILAGKGLVPLQSMNPLYVDFTLPEEDMKDLYINQPIELQLEAYPGQKFNGKITAVNSTVEVATRSIAVQATVPNETGQLYPGMFAKVAVILPQQKNIITVPQTAIAYSLYGDSVYVIQHGIDKKTHQPALFARQRFVKVGQHTDNFIEVLSGIKAGEEVVTSGQIKLYPGSRVVINNSVNLT